jgi:HAD superfamily hydrolase (TIGR01509 family)
MKYYDITAVLSDKLPVYGGAEPGVTISAHSSMERGDRCNVSLVTFGSHNGTHADMPKHFIDDGETCETMPLGAFFGSARVLDLRPFLQGRKQVEVGDLLPFDIQPHEIIILNMGNSHLMREPAFTRDYVSVSREAASYLADLPIKTVGVDYLSIEKPGGTGFSVHQRLLGKGIAILEGLVLDGPPEVYQGRYLLSALPLKLPKGDGSPVRAVLADEFKLELVIFDMDGLVLDTEPCSHRGWCEAGRQMGFDMGEELYRRMIGTNYNVCKERMKEYMGYSFDFEEAYAIRTDYVRTHTAANGIQLKKGVREILDALEAHNIKKCIATSTDIKRANEMLKSVDLLHRFAHVIGGNEIKNGKPAPDIFIKAAEQSGARPEGCLVLEDSEAGAEAAYRAGMRAVIVPDLYEPTPQTRARVCAVCRDLNETADFITARYVP